MSADSHLAWLFERMSEADERVAIVWADDSVTYPALLDAILRWRGELDRQGVVAGQVVAVDGDYHPEACAALLALIDRGAIVVPLTSATSSQHREFLELAEAGRLLSFTESGDAWSWTEPGHELRHPLLVDVVDRSVPGLVVFSSGSTGASKGMVHDLSRLLSKFTVQREPLVTISFLLFDHLGGLNTLLHTLSNGGTIVASRVREPDAICSLIALHHVELLPVSPTFIGLMLLSKAHLRHDLSSLRMISYGTELMPQATLDRARAELPNVEFRQTYGLSETGVLRTKSRPDGSLWLRVGGEGIETKVVDGTLWVRSKWAITGYLNAPHPFDDEGWFNTEDRVDVDGEYVRFLGRETDIINVGGNKVYPAEVESCILEVDGVQDVVVFAESNALTGQVVAARVVVEGEGSPQEWTRTVRMHVAQRLERFKVPARVTLAEATTVSARFKKIRA